MAFFLRQILHERNEFHRHKLMAMDERMQACAGIGADIHHYFFLTDCHMELLGNPPYDYHCFLVYMRGYGKPTHITDNVECNGNEI